MPAPGAGNLSRVWEAEQESEAAGLRLYQLYEHLQQDSEQREELAVRMAMADASGTRSGGGGPCAGRRH